jgi:hypothetical protein
LVEFREEKVVVPDATKKTKTTSNHQRDRRKSGAERVQVRSCQQMMWFGMVK